MSGEMAGTLVHAGLQSGCYIALARMRKPFPSKSRPHHCAPISSMLLT